MLMSDSYVDLLKNMNKNADVSIVADSDFGGSYDWDVARVYRVKSASHDVYYLGSDCGCSCDWYDENPAFEDLMEFSSRRSLLSYLRKVGEDEAKFKDLHRKLLSNR